MSSLTSLDSTICAPYRSPTGLHADESFHSCTLVFSWFSLSSFFLTTVVISNLLVKQGKYVFGSAIVVSP